MILGIAGGSASGKTTLAGDLKAIAIDLGISSDIIALDSFYKNLYAEPSANYDLPVALNFVECFEVLTTLLSSGVVDVPVYDYCTHSRAANSRTIKRPKLLILEGMYAFWDSSIRNLLDKKIWVETPESLRLERKLHRDVLLRSRTREQSQKQWVEQTLPAFNSWIEPTKVYGEIVWSGVSWNRESCVDLLVELFT